MKRSFTTSVFLGICLFSLASCGQSITPTASPVPLTTATSSVANTHLSSETPSPTITPTDKPQYVPPTLIPTTDPTLVSELLNKAFSIQTVEGVNGYEIKKITGWDSGYGTLIWYAHCPAYVWLDTTHLLLYPGAGQVYPSEGMGINGINVVPQSVIMNVDSASVWLPPVVTASERTCKRVYWSPELQIIITYQNQDHVSTVSTYTYDGHKQASYLGNLVDVSPTGKKILVDGDTLIDLQTNRKIKLAWSLEDYYEPMLSDLYWTYPEETRIYRCCYFYADIVSGVSHRFQRSDFHLTNGNHLKSSGLWFHQGEWVLGNRYFLISWLPVDDGDVKYLPMFDPATKLFYDVRQIAGIPDEWTWLYNDVSPDSNYLWMAGWDGSYLVNLGTFETQQYPYRENSYTYTDTDWSANSKFVWFQIYDSETETREFQLISISDIKSSVLPVAPMTDSNHWWHPTGAVVAYPSADQEMLIFLDADTMSYRELSFTLQKHPTFDSVMWSPTGVKLALVKEDGSVWQVDYPALENLEQLMPSLADVSYLDWSPDGNSISFVSGSDIYIVDTTK